MPSPAPETQRLFFALWPDDELRGELHHLARKVARVGGGKPMAPENLHITLAFLGSISADARLCVENLASSLQVAPFSLTLDQVGYWPRPRVIWFGASETPMPLRQLAQGLNAGLANCGLTPEARPFAAHLTVMRKASRGPDQGDIAPLVWPVDSFVLVQSLTLPEGAQYRVLRHWPLRESNPVQG